MTTAPRNVASWRPPELGHGAHAAVGDVPDTALDDARRAGWMEGHSAAMAERAVAAEETAGVARAAALALRQTADQLRGQVASTVHALAVAIAQHLLERELSQDPAALRVLLNRALMLAPMSGTVVVRLHPDDLAALQTIGGLEPPAIESNGADLRWIGDVTVTRGSCMVEGPNAIIDGRIDRALLDIYERISHD
jgi:flagellar assembly protein FliH